MQYLRFCRYYIINFELIQQSKKFKFQEVFYVEEKKKKVKLIPRNINKAVGSVKNLNTTTPGLFDYKKIGKI